MFAVLLNKEEYLNVKRYAIMLSIVIMIIMTGSPISHRAVQHDTPVTIRAIPPIFITLDHIPECLPEASFPQANPLPYFSKAAQIQFSCDVYEKDNVAWVMLIFYESWIATFGGDRKKLKAALDRLTIVWGREVKTVNNVYDMHGNFLESASVSGLMEDSSTIWVWAESDAISDSSFIHELVHIALHHTCGDADADHEGTEYSCWLEGHSIFIDEINLRLKENYDL